MFSTKCYIYWQGSSSVVKFGFSWLGEKTKLRVYGV